jgi:hypothetical protein
MPGWGLKPSQDEPERIGERRRIATNKEVVAKLYGVVIPKIIKHEARNRSAQFTRSI